ncbi:MAG: phosphopantothenoylcysteine decarboxylase [bacterium]
MKNFNGKKILITAGPTREYLDPVRFLSNASSGIMGYALAREARKKGARVTLVSGPVNVKPPDGVRVISVISAREMKRAVDRLFPRMDYVVCAAAVSDYRPAGISKTKLKKSSNPNFLKLMPNPDILKTLGKRKKNQKLIGFALETNNLIANAKKKLKTKNLDLIIANHPHAIEQTKAKIYIIGRKIAKLPPSPKKKLAQKILTIIADI